MAGLNLSTPQEVLDYISANDIRIIDIRFSDLLGTWQHFSTLSTEIDEDTFVAVSYTHLTLPTTPNV